MTTTDKAASTAPAPVLFDLADLDARKAGETPFPMPFVGPDGGATGVVLMVLGGHCEKVQNAINKAQNDRKAKEILQAQSVAKGAALTTAFTPVEDEKAFVQRLAAVRLAGWSGIKQSYSPELALALCQSNPALADQVIEASNNLANFMKLSPTT